MRRSDPAVSETSREHFPWPSSVTIASPSAAPDVPGRRARMLASRLVAVTEVEQVALDGALDRVLAEDVVAG